MHKKLKLLTATAAVMLLAACGTAPSSTVPSSVAPSQSSEAVVSASSESEASSESSSDPAVSAAPAVVETQTKQVQGFGGSVADGGELYVNGVILDLGGTIAELQAKLEQTPDMGVYSDKSKAAFDEEMAKEDGMGAFGDGRIVLDRTEASHSNVGVRYTWRNTTDSAIKRIQAKVLGLEANYETNDEVAEWNKITPAEVRQIEAVLPNGWYLGGTVSVEDRLALTSTAPEIREADRFTWYTYPMGEAGNTLKLKFDTQTGVLSGVQLDDTKR